MLVVDVCCLFVAGCCLCVGCFCFVLLFVCGCVSWCAVVLLFVVRRCLLLAVDRCGSPRVVFLGWLPLFVVCCWLLFVYV